ncbi:serine/threonine protein kinase [Halomonas sp. hl-4]|uniref:serine/threonine protein kinase n=1 Tax=Halomonas sp. hl-4 TaxID=1761789 RepID=UPI000BB9A7B1|nr:serine/threonine protein kinase [Halomonas sp. hl-4]SNY95963.1 Ser/Thr protein kinase RdoA involved in Cpx stress response, MazF antagonist [Halomonas sp. hl-4]
MTHAFRSLSPGLVMSAVESLDIWPTSEPFALNSYENRVMMFRDDQGEQWIIKFYRPERWQDATIQEEHDFLSELSQAGVPVAAVWRDASGRSQHHYEGFRFTLFHHCPGQAPELDNDAHLFALGELMGQLHDVSSKATFAHRPRLVLVDGVLNAQQRVLDSQRLDRHQRRGYESVITRMLEALAPHQWEDDVMIRCHGDCHLGNILGRDEHFSLVDFDDCLMAPAIQDIWMLLSANEPEEWRRQMSEIVEGYEESRPFPHQQVALIEPLRAYRLIRHSAWLVSRWEDPAFQRAFPWVADKGYWDQHIRQLEQQLMMLKSPRWFA